MLMTNIAPELPPLEHLPEAVQALRTDRERAFCWFYMWNGGDGAKAARAAGYSDVKEGAKVQAHRLLLRQDILDALREMGQRYLYALQPKALVRIGALIGSKNQTVALKASLATLSRTGLTERTGVDVNVSGQVQVNHADAAVEDLRRLVALGVPEERLIETFGHSGLSRYRKLLAASDAAKAVPAIIEGGS